MRPIFLLPMVLLLASPLCAQSNSKGPSSAIVVGELKSATADGFHVLQGGEHLRKLVVNNQSQVRYVGMPDESDHKPTPGYGVKAKVGKDGAIKSILFTHPVGKTVSLGNERLAMSEQELFSKVDADHNGHVSYVEFSRAIYYSPKHGPDGFGKCDKDGNGGLNLKEFSRHLSGVSWWKLSRKTPGEWIAGADENRDGKLSMEEFKFICTSGNHIDNVFRRTDKDKSGDLSFAESTAYIRSITHKQ